MKKIRDGVRLVAIACALVSFFVYVNDGSQVALVAFLICTLAFIVSFETTSYFRILAIMNRYLGRLSILCTISATIANTIREVRARLHNRGRPQPVRVKAKIHTESKLESILGPPLRKVLDIVIDAGTLKRVYSELNPNMLKSVTLSGVATDLKKLRREAGRALVVSGILAITLVVLVVLVSVPIFYVAPVFALPVLVLFYPRIKLQMATSERKHALVDEMTFFAVYSLLLAEVGKTVVYALASIAGRSIFPALELEARVMERGRGLGMGKMVALGDLGRNHPNRDFGNLIGGYVAAFNAGDPKAHLKSQSDELLKRLYKRLEAYKESSSSLCVMVTFMMFFLPVMVTPIAMIAGSSSALFLVQVSLVAMPIMTAMVCVLAHIVQPKFGDMIKIDWRAPILLTIVISFVSWMIFPDKVWFIMAISAITFSACAVAMTHKKRHVASVIDRNQALFFRDITSYVSAGDSSISHAMNKTVESNAGRYDSIFLDIISRANFRIRYAGELVQDVLADIARESWLGKFSFFLLSRIADTGTVDAWVLTMTTEFVEKFVRLKRDIISATRPYMIIAAASPVGVVAMTWFLESFLVGIPSSLGGAQSFGIGIAPVHATDVTEFDEATSVLTVASAICANIAVSKIASMSMSDMRALLVGSTVALLCILVVPHLPAPV